MALPYADAPPSWRPDFARESYLGRSPDRGRALVPRPPRSNCTQRAAEGGRLLDPCLPLPGPPLRGRAAGAGLFKALPPPHPRGRRPGGVGRGRQRLHPLYYARAAFRIHSIWAPLHTHGTVLHGRHWSSSSRARPPLWSRRPAGPPTGAPEYLGIPNCYHVPVPRDGLGEIAPTSCAPSARKPATAGWTSAHIAEHKMMAPRSARSWKTTTDHGLPVLPRAVDLDLATDWL